MSVISDVLIVGAGSAGLLAALSFQRLMPAVRVRVVRSTKIPVIGVGESTTAAFPTFLHTALGLDRGEFYRQVRPSWKLGIRFIWGSRTTPHFYYPFDARLDYQRPEMRRWDAYFCVRGMQDATPYSILMDRGTAPWYPGGERGTVDEGFGYHLDNRQLIAYLEQQSRARGIQILAGDVQHVPLTEDGSVACLELEQGEPLRADLYVDCSGFLSLLLGGALGESFVRYDDVLRCDRALVGSFPRQGPVLPYTTAETMEHGWCWRIEFEERVTRGYVFSSAYCSDEQAERELRAKNPEMTGTVRAVPFPCGRYENFWIKNVAAIGNASGFVEPLEATALHLVAEQIRLVCQGLLDAGGQTLPAMQRLQNRRFRCMWDDVRDFLALHYRFNERSESTFWQDCRRDTPLGRAAEIVELYQQAGPTRWLKKLISDDSMFGYSGYLTMLLGQRVPTACPLRIDDAEWRAWEQCRDQMRQRQASCPPLRAALARIHEPDWQW